MSVRVRVSAVRGTSADRVRDAYVRSVGPQFAELPVTEQNGWTSFRTSVWTVAGSDIVCGLVELNRPALMFTSEDGARWYVTLFGPGAEPETLLHEFGNHTGPLNENYWSVDDDEEDPESAAALELLDERRPDKPRTAFEKFAASMRDDFGCPLPASLVESTRGLSFNEAVARFQKWHQDRLIAFLQLHDVECNMDSVRRVLDWQGLTPSEVESDLGNLPRLLCAIGLGGEWAEFVRDAESHDSRERAGDDATDSEEPDDSGQETRPDQNGSDDERSAMTIVEEMLSDIGPSELKGGPATLPMKRFRLVEFIVQSCCYGSGIAATIALELPAAEQHLVAPLASQSRIEREGVEMRAPPTGFKLAFSDHRYIERAQIKECFGKSIAGLIADPPEGTVLEIAFASQDKPETRQIYRGVVREKAWHIETTYPSVPSGILREALALAADAHKLVQPVRNEAEAEAVLAMLSQSDADLHRFDADRMAVVHEPRRTITSSGMQVSEECTDLSVAEALFRLRYGDHWDVTPAEQFWREYNELLGDQSDGEDQEELTEEQQAEVRLFQQRMEDMKRAMAEAARAREAQRLSDPIHEGRAARYWQSDLDAMAGSNTEAASAFESGMSALGFVRLGDITTERSPTAVSRCYVHPHNLA